jgi:hypothetical protein
LHGKPAVPTYENLPDLFDELAALWPRREVLALRQSFERLRRYLGDRRDLVHGALGLRERLLAIPAAPASSLELRVKRRVEALERIVQHALAVRASISIEADRVAAIPGEPLPFVLTLFSDGLYPLSGIRITAHDDHDLRILKQGPTAEPNCWQCTAEWRVPDGADERQSWNRLFARERFDLPVVMDISFQVAALDMESQRVTLPMRLPVDIRSPAQLSVTPNPLLIRDGQESIRFAVRVRREADRALHGNLRITPPTGFVATPSAIDIDMERDVEKDFLVTLNAPTEERQRVRPVHVSLGKWITRVPLHRVSVDVPQRLRVGIVRGPDDTAPTILRELGVDLVSLDEELLPTRELSDLDTILIDIRALASHRAARAGLDRMMDFAKQGGRLVILYHKDSEFNLEVTGLRAYPTNLELHIGRGRITREDAPVTLLRPHHMLLNSPNRIRPEDWDGWVQERGLYFASRYSDAFEELLELADPGLPAERGALLFARIGRGEFVYCALALYRQLKNLHPGVVRLFVNLISSSSAPRRRRRSGFKHRRWARRASILA